MMNSENPREGRAAPLPHRLLTAVLAVAALLLGAGAVVVGTAGRANAVLEGTVTPSQTSGQLTDVPMFASASVSAGCPEGFQSGVGVFVLVGGAERVLTLPIRDGGPYDAPFDLTMPSLYPLSRWIDPANADGNYEIRVRCLPASGTASTHFFAFPIQVTGTTWSVVQADPAETTLRLALDPADQVIISRPYTLTATVTPAEAEGLVRFTAASRELGTARVENGRAELRINAASTPGTTTVAAAFTPADPTAFAPSSTTPVDYATVEEPGIEVRDENEDVIADNPVLAPGQRLVVTARGFRPGETVEVTLTGSEAGFPDVAAPEGTVAEHGITLPEDLADGEYTLTLTGATSGTAVPFPFTVGESDGADEGADQGGDQGADEGTDEGADAGTDEGADEGADSGADQGADAGGGGDAGIGGALDGGASGDSGSSGGVGPRGPLASTGAGLTGVGVLAALLVGTGALVVRRAHTAGRLRAFGHAPRD
ncbi:Ig-like domain repeat protein [Streptomyces hainanensis]|uniref:Bacterial Ig-like domain-containing protein n=1 Tax=Streptomyces hainanensis TaxID=402648 RepID=A0A4R4TAT6_9ACTN|nr:Ig-like domain repeat protein [Streptomyces hainanensis]TDC74518.1 hypothetical protein E1283_15475 [Streptomyces hainanensis]